MAGTHRTDRRGGLRALYTCYTAKQAREALEEVRRVLLRHKLELAELMKAKAGERNLWAIQVQKNMIMKLTDRRTFMEEQLRRAEWNEAHGIPPVGPKTGV